MKTGFVNIQEWMYELGCEDLREIVAYAIIFGFSQDGESKFEGSLQYIMRLLRCSKPTAISTLRTLVDKGLITKEQLSIQNVTFNRYAANLQVVKNLYHPSKISLPNNIVPSKEGTLGSNNNPVIEEENNISSSTPYNPPTTTEQERMFDEFRRAYRGTKRGLRTEFENFRKKHKDWREVLTHLLADYKRQVDVLDANKAAGAFVPQPKNLQTYINQRCWEEEITLSTQTQQSYGDANTRPSDGPKDAGGHREHNYDFSFGDKKPRPQREHNYDFSF